jgi:hypothetical protein
MLDIKYLTDMYNLYLMSGTKFLYDEPDMKNLIPLHLSFSLGVKYEWPIGVTKKLSCPCA